MSADKVAGITNSDITGVFDNGADVETLRSLLAQISRSHLMASTAEIAKQERLSGSPGEYEAFQWIQSQLDEYGFSTKLVIHDAYVSIPKSASLHLSDGTAIPCIGHAFTASTSKEGVTAPLVAVRSIEAALAEDVIGRIALVEGRASGMGTLRLEELGAVGQIYVHGERMHETAVSPQWGSPTDLVQDKYPTTPGVAIREIDGNALKALLEYGNGVTVTLSTEIATEWVKTPLLTADLSGPSADFVLLSCHVDAWHLGAMDNGSANATVIEVGRIIAGARSSLRRGLRLAFWSGHSHGKYSGSAWYADNHWHELREFCVAHVNCDSTGGIGASDLTLPPTMPETHAIAERAIDLVTGTKIKGKRVGRFGDQSFLGIGIPSLYASLSGQPNEPTEKSKAESAVGGRSTTLGWWWHTPEDTLDKVDPENLARDTCVYLATVFTLTHREILPFDFRKAVADARQLLGDYARQAPDSLKMEATLNRIDALETDLKDFYRRHDSEDQSSDAINAALVKLSRHLIPFRYHESNIFDHDWGGELVPVPGLQDLRGLDGLDPDSSRYKGTVTRLKRVINAIEYEIDCASRLLRNFRNGIVA